MNKQAEQHKQFKYFVLVFYLNKSFLYLSLELTILYVHKRTESKSSWYKSR